MAATATAAPDKYKINPYTGKLDNVGQFENYSGTFQHTLVSGTNIKTINGTSVLGPGNISVSGGSGGPPYYITDNLNSLTYMIISVSGLIGLQESTGVGGLYIITDTINFKNYKIMSLNGVVGMEEQ